MSLDDDIRSRGEGYQSFVVFTGRSKWLRLPQFMDFIDCEVLKIYKIKAQLIIFYHKTNQSILS